MVPKPRLAWHAALCPGSVRRCATSVHSTPSTSSKSSSTIPFGFTKSCSRLDVSFACIYVNSRPPTPLPCYSPQISRFILSFAVLNSFPFTCCCLPFIPICICAESFLCINWWSDPWQKAAPDFTLWSAEVVCISGRLKYKLFIISFWTSALIVGTCMCIVFGRC